ncbi:MAG: STAS domain-containing protein [Armatimonadetes bacterium]|nr:STAS domain-containing protein [Armatimonadota bacterium]
MTPLYDFIQAHLDEILEPYLALVKERIPRYGQADPETFPENTRRMLEVLPLAAADPRASEVAGYVDHLIEQRLPAGFQLTDILEAIFHYKDLIIPLIWEHEPQPQRRRDLVDALLEGIQNVGLVFARHFVDQQVALVEKQRLAMLELSTPVINVWDGILALPLIGTIDTYRARQIMDELLGKIAAQRAAIVLLDITGVPVVDTNVADHLIKTIRAAELLGARCMLVGIGPELAQTVVSLGVDLRSIASTADMRQGLNLAFQRLGLEVVPKERDQ